MYFLQCSSILHTADTHACKCFTGYISYKLVKIRGGSYLIVNVFWEFFPLTSRVKILSSMQVHFYKLNLGSYYLIYKCTNKLSSFSPCSFAPPLPQYHQRQGSVSCVFGVTSNWLKSILLQLPKSPSNTTCAFFSTCKSSEMNDGTNALSYKLDLVVWRLNMTTVLGCGRLAVDWHLETGWPHH